MNSKIQVVVAEDQAMVLGALAALLETEPDIAVCARAANGHEALTAIAKLKPNILATEVRDRYPQTRVVILTTFARPGYLRRALDAGAKGYLLKDRPAAELADAVRRVHRGLRVVDPDLAAEAWDSGPDPLTDRERQILREAGEGKSSQEIAEALHLSEGTVRNYLSEAISKLGAANRIDAARIARAKGWL